MEWNDSEPTPLVKCRRKRCDAVSGAFRLRELEALLRRRPGGRGEERLRASADVAEQLAAGEGVGDECDAPAAAAAVRAAEDVENCLLRLWDLGRHSPMGRIHCPRRAFNDTRPDRNERR